MSFLLLGIEGESDFYPSALEALAAARKAFGMGRTVTLWEQKPLRVVKTVTVDIEDSPQSEPVSANPPSRTEAPAAGEVLPCPECDAKFRGGNGESRMAALTAHYEVRHPDLAAKWKVVPHA